MLVLIFSIFVLNILIAVNAGLTEKQKVQILAAFNEARSTTLIPAANMRELTWDDGIAAEMQAYTELCDMTAWKQFRDPPAEFLYRDRAADPVGVAKWRTLRMAPYVDYKTGECIDTPQSIKICRNPIIYHRVAFAGNERIGCGVTRCGPGPKGVYHACGVAPNRNYEDARSKLPWIEGARCSKCPAGYTGGCVNRLCRKSAAATSSSPTPAHANNTST